MPQRTAFLGADWMDGINPALGPPDMQAARLKLDIVPAQTDQLGRPEAVAIGDQDRGGIPVTVAVAPSGIDQPLDLATGQVVSTNCYSLPIERSPITAKF